MAMPSLTEELNRTINDAYSTTGNPKRNNTQSNINRQKYVLKYVGGVIEGPIWYERKNGNGTNHIGETIM